MFYKNVKTCKSIVKKMCFERLQVEAVNGKRLQEHIKTDANKHTKLNGKLCWKCSTNEAINIEKKNKFRIRKKTSE